MPRRRRLGGSPGDAAGDAPVVKRPPRNILFKVALFSLFAVIVIRVVGAQSTTAPVLAADCTSPAFALSTYAVQQGKPLTYAIVGPAAGSYVLGFDADDVAVAPDGSVIVTGGGTVRTPVLSPGETCRVTGQLGTPLDPGTHIATLFDVAASPPRQVQRETFAITDP